MKKKNLLLTAIAIFGLATITNAQVPSYVPTNGLVGWWPFSGNANDESGNNYNGTVNGATLTTDRFGNVNSAYSFNGSSDYIQVADATALRLSGTDYTISVWFNETYLVNTEHQAIISKRNPYTPPANLDGWLLYIDVLTSPMGKVGIVPAGYPNTCAYTANPITLNNWVNIVEVYHSGTQIVETYMNGVLNNTTTGVSSPNNTTTLPLYIGSDKESNSYFFNGKIDDIGIWNRALTYQEITDLYNGCQLSVSTQPINQAVNISNNAQFTTASSDPLATYQWQTDLGVGFQNLNSVGQYSGTANDTLTIANTTFSNNNQPFRCIISSGSCTDTSNVAVLTVNNNVGINEFTQNNLFSVYPNPAKSQINVKADATLLGSVYTVYDNIGKVVLSGKINSENTVIELGNLSGGIYLFTVGENMKQTFRVIKE
jgi:hypothetical protein